MSRLFAAAAAAGGGPACVRAFDRAIATRGPIVYRTFLYGRPIGPFLAAAPCDAAETQRRCSAPADCSPGKRRDFDIFDGNWLLFCLVETLSCRSGRRRWIRFASPAAARLSAWRKPNYLVTCVVRGRGRGEFWGFCDFCLFRAPWKSRRSSRRSGFFVSDSVFRPLSNGRLRFRVRLAELVLVM